MCWLKKLLIIVSGLVILSECAPNSWPPKLKNFNIWDKPTLLLNVKAKSQQQYEDDDQSMFIVNNNNNRKSNDLFEEHFKNRTSFRDGKGKHVQI